MWSEPQEAPRTNTAVPVVEPPYADFPERVARGKARVLVIDTGVEREIRPPGLGPGRPSRARELAIEQLEAVTTSSDRDMWDDDNNHILDPFGGHGTFIAGLIARLAPGASITVDRGLCSFGDTDDVTVAQRLLDRMGHGPTPEYDVVSFSFGGYCENDDPPLALERALEIVMTRARIPDPHHPDHVLRSRVAVVASAGNDGSCRPTWPASFEMVTSVGAIGPHGPAPFTNYGPWVQTCAPGMDLASTFFDLTGSGSGNSERFDGWARWSGSSFSAPVVAATIAWEWMSRGSTGAISDAARWLIDRPSLARYPGLGTVFNMP